MILQALKEYYDRKAVDPESGIAPEGWERKEIPFLIVLSAKGTPVGIDDTREMAGRKLRAKTFLVPQGVKRTVGIAANLLWDNPEYAVGVVTKGNPDRTREAHDAFVKRIADLGCGGEAIPAVLRFLKREDKIALLEVFSPWKDIKESGAFLSFRLAGEKEPVFRSQEVVKTVSSPEGDVCSDGHLCMVNGERDIIERLHPAVKGVRGANSTGANIVGFNLDAFRSFGKEQGANAPVGRRAVFAYTTALNTLLGKDSRQKLQVGDASVVVWATKTCDLEQQIADIFGEPPKDDPDRHVKAVEGLFRSLKNGAYVEDKGTTRFHVLGLAPNAARIAVRFWIVDTVEGMAYRIRQHFEDTRIVHGPRDADTLPLFRLLVSTAVQGKADNIPPNLGGDTMRAILEGLPYPQTLLQAAIRRVRAERDVTYARAALIKACVNRETRRDKNNKEEELTVSLDEKNINIGYRLGRLFATLEKIQQDASPGINATIRDRFYGAASSTPVTVFGNLMRLANHHLSKVEKEMPGLAVVRKQLLQEVMCEVPDFPAHLALADQGRFAIGYYHQTQKFYEKKVDTTNNKEAVQ